MSSTSSTGRAWSRWALTANATSRLRACFPDLRGTASPYRRCRGEAALRCRQEITSVRARRPVGRAALGSSQKPLPTLEFLAMPSLSGLIARRGGGLSPPAPVEGATGHPAVQLRRTASVFSNADTAAHRGAYDGLAAPYLRPLAEKRSMVSDPSLRSRTRIRLVAESYAQTANVCSVTVAVKARRPVFVKAE